jgi:dihydrofolate reductase
VLERSAKHRLLAGIAEPREPEAVTRSTELVEHPSDPVCSSQPNHPDPSRFEVDPAPLRQRLDRSLVALAFDDHKRRRAGHVGARVHGGSPYAERKGQIGMSKVKVNITMSLDGYVAGPSQSEEVPLGIGGEQLHQWLVPLEAFRKGHGGEGGEVNASTPIAEEILGNVGATIMGRNMFGGGPGPWRDDPWKGYWGDDPPFHHPVFVLTRYPREPLEMEGGTTFHFVTDGIESALEQASAAAGDKAVSIGGGANVVQQYLAAGLLDELLISVVPIFLGGGARLFDNLGDPGPMVRQVEAIEAPGVTHIRYARSS